MFSKKISSAKKAEALEKAAALIPGIKAAEEDIREVKLRWLSAFAPDMTLRDAKDYCLPRMRFKNHLWHAFSFRLTDCPVGEEAAEKYNGFSGECFVLDEETNSLYTVGDGSPLSASLLSKLGNVTVFTKSFTETFSVTGMPEVGPFYKKAVI